VGFRRIGRESKVDSFEPDIDECEELDKESVFHV
jgi:hypothetical protein